MKATTLGIALLLATLLAACASPAQPPSTAIPAPGPGPAAAAASKPDGIPAPGDVSRVRLVGFALSQPPAPLPANAAQGRAVTARVLGWLAGAEVLGTLSADQIARGEDYDLPRNRSTVLYLDLQNGTRVALRQAYDCASTPKDGGVSTTCQSRAGEVMFFPAGDQRALRLRAPELATWLQDGWQKDVPMQATAAVAEATATAAVKTEPTPLANGPAAVPQAALGVDDAVATLVAGGLSAVRTGKDIPRLFGAQSVEVISVDGETIQVYVFADELSAARAFKDASDPQLNTVSWATEPHFVQHRNLLITIVISDEAKAARIAAVLSPVAPAAARAAATPGSAAADLQRTGLQAVMAQPSAPAAVSPDQARAAAARVLGAAAAGTTVTAEYTLLTLPGTPGMTARPVYLVTYDGVPLLPTGPGPSGDAAVSAARGPVRGKVTAVIDANTGDWIMGIAR